MWGETKTVCPLLTVRGWRPPRDVVTPLVDEKCFNAPIEKCILWVRIWGKNRRTTFDFTPNERIFFVSHSVCAMYVSFTRWRNRIARCREPVDTVMIPFRVRRLSHVMNCRSRRCVWMSNDARKTPDCDTLTQVGLDDDSWRSALRSRRCVSIRPVLRTLPG